MDYLELPLVDFYQLRVEYKTIDIEAHPNTELKLNNLLKKIEEYKTEAIVRTKKNFKEDSGTTVITEQGFETAFLDLWLSDIAKESFNIISFSELKQHQEPLEKLFSKVTYTLNGQTVFNELFDRKSINSQVRLAFSAKRTLETEEETVPKNAQLLITENLIPFPNNEKLYPNEEDVKTILDLDKRKAPVEVDENQIQQFYEIQKEAIKGSPLELMFPNYESFRKPYDYSLAVKSKNQTFHYLPYNFWQSNFEKQIQEEILKLDEFKSRKLEVYYNGERGLTEFEIKCFAKEGKYWRNIGKYTPDFLIVKRKKKELNKILILETKGKGYADQPIFQKKKHYVSSDFLQLNNEKFGYKRF